MKKANTNLKKNNAKLKKTNTKLKKEARNYGLCGTRIARQQNPDPAGSSFDLDFCQRFRQIDEFSPGDHPQPEVVIQHEVVAQVQPAGLFPRGTPEENTGL